MAPGRYRCLVANDDLSARVSQLLAETGRAHHQAYLATDGEDPEWPIWYAGYIKEPLAEILGAGLTQSEIVYHLVAADREDGDGSWQDRYAARLIAAAP